MKILKKWLQRRQQRKASKANLRALSDIASRHTILDRLADSGLLYWSAQHRQLFIAQSLAALFLRDADTWTAFIHNVHEWLYLRLCSDAWEQYMQKEELAAVRAAMSVPSGSPAGEMSRPQIDAIKTARRREIAMSDMEPPKVEPFEFVIIQESDKPVEPLAVGHYDPVSQHMEVALWQDVKQYLHPSIDHQ